MYLYSYLYSRPTCVLGACCFVLLGATPTVPTLLPHSQLELGVSVCAVEWLLRGVSKHPDVGWVGHPSSLPGGSCQPAYTWTSPWRVMAPQGRFRKGLSITPGVDEIGGPPFKSEEEVVSRSRAQPVCESCVLGGKRSSSQTSSPSRPSGPEHDQPSRHTAVIVTNVL